MAKGMFPLKRGGILKEVSALPAGYTNDGVFGHTISGKHYIRINTGPVYSQEAGIFNDGDQTARINTVLALSKLKDIIFHIEGGGSFTIAGTVTVPAGKHIHFTPGTMLSTSGAGVWNGGIIHTDLHSQIFAGTLNFNPESFASQETSVKSWGAKGDDSQDDQPAIQKAVDYCVNNPTKINRVRMPAGTYRIDSPIFIKEYSGGKYNFCYVQILGDFRYTSPTVGTILNVTFKDRFALGMQLAKGVHVKGLYIKGLFVPPATSGAAFFNMAWSAFVDATFRDTAYSPACGIAVDPVRNAVPADGGYPGMTADYKGSNANEGSTGLTFEDIRIDGFPVGFITSPNGHTLNAELITINNLQIANCRTGIVGCQAQEKLNVINNLMCWEATHTLFMQGAEYGAQTSGHWKVNGVNIAGAVNRFIYHPNSDWFPTYVEDFFSESLGTFGLFNSEVGSTVSKGEMSFHTLENGVTLPTAHIEGVGVIFREMSIRDSLQNVAPVIIKGNHTFVECSFNKMPFLSYPDPDSEPKTYGGQSRFLDCYVGGIHLSPSNAVYTTDLNPYPVIGNHTLVNNGTERSGIFEVVKVEPYKYTLEVYSDQYEAYTVTNNSFTIPVPANQLYKFQVGYPAVLQYKSMIAGIISEVNYTNNTVTVIHAPKHMIDFGPTTARIGCSYPMVFPGRFVGDMTNGSNQITNVVMDYGTVASLQGKWIKVHTTGGGGGDNQTFSYERVIGVSGTTITISDNMSITSVGHSFDNWSQKEVRMLDRDKSVSNYTKPFLKRDRAIIADSTEQVITKGGFGAAHADARKVEHMFIGYSGNIGFSNIIYYVATPPTLTDGTHIAHKKYVDDAVAAVSGGGGGMTLENAATYSAISASTTPRLVRVAADETNNGDISIYLHNGTALELIQTLTAS